MKQKFTLLNCEGDFLLVEKNGSDWFFKLLIQIESVKGSKSTYQLDKTDPIEILNFLKGAYTIYHDQYPKSINYLNYGDDYKSRSILKNLIQTLIDELIEGISINQEEFLKGFAIPQKRDHE
jgi:hypothetical protein